MNVLNSCDTLQQHSLVFPDTVEQTQTEAAKPDNLGESGEIAGMEQ